jgi:hypothetical protein
VHEESGFFTERLSNLQRPGEACWVAGQQGSFAIGSTF